MMSTWGKSGEGILRSTGSAGNKEELLVFGYSCKLFRDDDRAREVDQGKLLIPWGGDETLRIDRYDARGALHELASLEAPPGGHDWRLELTDAERRVEQLCDEERYRALYCDEDEEQMYKEEEFKRLRAAGYGQIGFNYDAETTKAEPPAPAADPAEADEPFAPSAQLQALLPPDVVLPDTQKLNAIIEKTAAFIARHGAQMEILLRAKQAGNAQFDFLDRGGPLHRYYAIVLDAMRQDKYNARPEKEPEVKSDDNEDYLHPSLAAPVIESAPQIPSIHYKPSADCDYTMLISRIKGTTGRDDDEPSEPAVAAGELAPPGTQPLTLPRAPDASEHDFNIQYYQYYDPPATRAQITRAPVLYAQSADQPQEACPSYPPPPPQEPPPPALETPAQLAARPDTSTGTADGDSTVNTVAAPAPTPIKSSGLDLMHYYNSGSESEHSEAETEAERTEPPVPRRPPLVTPPSDVRIIIDKMAAYVARNGDQFQDIVKAKKDPRFTFLDDHHPYHTYYRRLMLEKRGGAPPADAEALPAEAEAPPTHSDDARSKEEKKKTIAPVSFSIKKLKEPEAILPKPALPYESSSDEEKEPNETDPKPTESATTQETTPAETAKCVPSPENSAPQTQIPQSFIYRVDATVTDEKPTLYTPPVENVHPKDAKKAEEKVKKSEEKLKKPEEKVKKPEEKVKNPEEKLKKPEEKLKKPEEKSDRKRKSKSKVRENGEVKKSKKHKSRSRERDRSRDRDISPSKEKDKEVKKSSSREQRVSRSRGGSRERSKSREKKEKTEVITVADRSEDELIDLTGDISDGRGEVENSGDRSKQMERKRRAAAFLAAVGRDVTSVAPPPVVEDNTLACAMVRTLESLRAKKEAAERRRARRAEREKRARLRRERAREEEERERERQKEKEKEKSHHKSKRRKRRSSIEEEGEQRDSSSKRKKHKSEKKHSSKRKKRRRSRDSSPASSESGTPPRRKTKKDTAKSDKEPREENGAEKRKTEVDVAAIKSKLKMLREESEEELEARRWRAGPEGERKKRKEYSEGEWETSEEKESSSSGGSESEVE